MSVKFEDAVEPEDVEALYRLILGRSLENAQHGAQLSKDGVRVSSLLRSLIESDEFRLNFKSPKDNKRITDAYRIPTELSVSADSVKRVLLIGSCQIEPWENTFKELAGDQIEFESRVMNRVSNLPILTNSEAAAIDFQIIQISLRSIMPERLYFNNSFSDNESYEKSINSSLELLKIYYDYYLTYNKNHGLTSFVLGFYTPQQNPMGRLSPRYHLSNPKYYIERLNKALYEIVSQSHNTYFIDFDEIINNFGKRHFQDDLLQSLNHGNVIGFHTQAQDYDRLEPIGDFEELHSPNISLYLKALLREVLGAYRTIRQTDSIKIVIFDLDDTLWRGVAADTVDFAPESTEGWPISMIEVAAYLWRRGILIAIVSKNDETTALASWEQRYGKTFDINNFVVRKIDWNSKAYNVSEVLKAVNLLPENALFVDDNPVERATVKEGIPGIRVLNNPLVEWRRLLMWSPELQPAVITSEAAGRSSMISAQIQRDNGRAMVDRGTFLLNLDVEVRLHLICKMTEPLYDRCFELINKTNQFNTTGRRWSPAEFHSFLGTDGYFAALEVKDKFTNYGIVVVAVVSDSVIKQIVMSCRVFGLDVEFAALALLTAHMRKSGIGAVVGETSQSGKNRLSLALFADAGFSLSKAGVWWLPDDCKIAVPSHVRH